MPTRTTRTQTVTRRVPGGGTVRVTVRTIVTRKTVRLR